MNHVFKKTLLALSVAGLVACGGGGGGGSTGGGGVKPAPTPTPTPTSPVVSVASKSVTEGDTGVTTVEMTVKLSKSSTSAVTVNYATEDGTATAGEDYEPASGSITFAAGETSKTVSVNVIGDIEYADNDGDETFKFNLSNASGADLGSSATVTINNDDMSKEEALSQLIEVYKEAEAQQSANAVAGSCACSRTLDVDLDGDGDLDMLVLAREESDHVNNVDIYQDILIVRNLLGKGYVLESSGIDGYIRDYQVADFNNDGLDDVMLIDHGYDFSPFPGGQDKLLLQTSNGGLVDGTTTNMPQRLDFSHGSCIGDFDKNGFVDAFVSPHFSLLMNNNGVFSDANDKLLNYDLIDKTAAKETGTYIPSMEFGIWTCGSGDVDQDGDIDIILGSGLSEGTDAYGNSLANSLVVLFNDGSGNFEYKVNDSIIPSYRPLANLTVMDVVTFDYNNDNCDDIATAVVENDIEDGNMLLIHKSNCDGTYDVVEEFDQQNSAIVDFERTIYETTEGKVMFTVPYWNTGITKFTFNGDIIDVELNYTLTNEEKAMVGPSLVVQSNR